MKIKYSFSLGNYINASYKYKLTNINSIVKTTERTNPATNKPTQNSELVCGIRMH